MNEDALKVRRIDLPSAFPTLRILESITLALNPMSVVSSIFASGVLVSVEWLFGRPGSGESGDAVLRLLIDLRALAVRGSEAGVFSSLGVFLRLGLFSFLGLVVGRFVVNRMCQQQLQNPRNTPLNPSPLMAALTVCALTVLLLFTGWIGLRSGQQATKLLAGSFHVSPFSSLPAVLSGVIFLMTSVVVLAAWSLTATSIAAEKSDGLEAFSRCFSYCLSRPLRVTCLLAIGYGLSRLFRLATAYLCSAAASLQNAGSLPSSGTDGDDVQQIADFLGQSLGLSSFMTALSIAYLLVRLAEDGVVLKQQ